MKKRKQKIQSSIASRFRVTKNGKVLRLSSFGRHLKRNKTRKQLRHLKRPKPLEKKLAKKVKKLLGY